MPYPTLHESFILLYSTSNPRGPWAGDIWSRNCPFNSLEDPLLWQRIQLSNPETDTMKADLAYYLQNNLWIYPPQKSRGNLLTNTDPTRLSRGRDIFKMIFEDLIAPSFLESDFGAKLWDFVAKRRTEL